MSIAGRTIKIKTSEEGFRVKRRVLAIYLMGNRLASSGVKNIANEGRGGDSRKLVITLQELLHHGLEVVAIRPVEGNIGSLVK